jgi:hypothetical protein
VPYRIACEGIDLLDVLQDFGGNQGYLSLPMQQHDKIRSETEHSHKKNQKLSV